VLLIVIKSRQVAGYRAVLFRLRRKCIWQTGGAVAVAGKPCGSTVNFDRFGMCRQLLFSRSY